MVLITHKLADVAACADRIVIMRGGKVVDRAAVHDRTPEALVEAMVGRGTVRQLERPPPPSSDVPLLCVRDLSAEVQGRAIQNISLQLSAGENFSALQGFPATVSSH